MKVSLEAARALLYETALIVDMKEVLEHRIAQLRPAAEAGEAAGRRRRAQGAARGAQEVHASGGALHAAGQGVLHRDGQHRGLRVAADPRRLRLHARLRRGAPQPRRAHHQHLRGHDAAAGRGRHRRRARRHARRPARRVRRRGLRRDAGAARARARGPRAPGGGGRARARAGRRALPRLPRPPARRDGHRRELRLPDAPRGAGRRAQAAGGPLLRGRHDRARRGRRAPASRAAGPPIWTTSRPWAASSSTRGTGAPPALSRRSRPCPCRPAWPCRAPRPRCPRDLPACWSCAGRPPRRCSP